MATPNVLTYAELFQTALDQQFMQESTTAWMEANASQVRYNGGNKIKIPKIVMEGLGDYSRSSGFDDGAVTLDWEEHTFDYDRGKEFNLDAMDYDETNFVAGAGMIMSEFQRVKVVPEVDAYRYSKIFRLANAALKTGAYTPAVGTVYGQLKADIQAIQDVIGETEPLAIAISYSASGILDDSDDIDKSISLIDFTNGSLNTKVKSIDGIPMFRVPSSVFKTAFNFSATNGFSAAATAMNINWVVASRRAIVAVVKTDKVRIFAPDQNQTMDAWKIQYRKYQTLLIPTNKLAAVYVSYTAIAAPALTATFAAGTGTGNTKATVTASATGNTFAYSKTTAEVTGVLFNSIPTGLTAYTSGADIAAAATDWIHLYELDAAGHVVKFISHDLTAGEVSS